MGWVESSGFFCTVTKSARDLTQHFVNNEVALPWDPVEDLMAIETWMISAMLPLSLWMELTYPQSVGRWFMAFMP